MREEYEKAKKEELSRRRALRSDCDLLRRNDSRRSVPLAGVNNTEEVAWRRADGPKRAAGGPTTCRPRSRLEK